MSDASTRTLIAEYMEEASAPLFLSGFFKSPPQNFHTSEKVEIDVIRDEEEVAVVIEDLSAGARANEATLYTNKAFTPPIYDEMGAINAYNQIKRRAGQNPFVDPEYGSNALNEATRIFRKLERKIRRAIELQASQVLQTGKLALKDSAGSTLYTLDFSPKTTHFVTTTQWAADGSTGDPIGDITSLADEIRRSGKCQPSRLIFGSTAMRSFLANATVQKNLVPFGGFGSDVGRLAPEAQTDARGVGATKRGFIWIGHDRFELWMYNGWYKHPQTGVLTPYVGDNNVIVMSENGRLDLSFGAIPRLVEPDPRAMPFLPPRMSSPERGLDLTTNAWLTPDGKNLMVSAGTRPLTIPTAIDSFGCLVTH
jgi:hypothetical protein